MSAGFGGPGSFSSATRTQYDTMSKSIKNIKSGLVVNRTEGKRITSAATNVERAYSTSNHE